MIESQNAAKPADWHSVRGGAGRNAPRTDNDGFASRSRGMTAKAACPGPSPHVSLQQPTLVIGETGCA